MKYQSLEVKVGPHVLAQHHLQLSLRKLVACRQAVLLSGNILVFPDELLGFLLQVSEKVWLISRGIF